MTRIEWIVQLSVGLKWMDVSLHYRQDLAETVLAGFRTDHPASEFRLVRRVITAEVIG